jgi:predicted ATPase
MLVASLLNLDPKEVLPLADLIHGRTLGNTLNIVLLLESLRLNKLLTCDDGKWSWKVERIRAETSVSDEVAELILSKVHRLHAFVQGILKLGSCFGYQFRADLLKLVALGSIPSEIEEARATYNLRIDQALDVAAQEGLIETLVKPDEKAPEYKFVHDRIEQALYDLFTEHKRQSCHLVIGKMLQRHLVQSKELEKHHSDNLVFLAVEQLDRGLALIKQEDQVSIAELNLNAAHRAMSKSAFQAAPDYVQIAADLLNSHWETNYELTMRVHTTAAQFHSCTGRFEECARTADAALGNAKRTMDKLPIYYTMIDALASQDLLSDALDLGVEVLNKELCVKTPRRASSLQVLRELNLVWRMIGKKTDDDLLTLPTISHKVLAAAMRVTMEISMIAFFAQENKNYPFLWLRAMKLTLMYGQDRVTPSIFACYGILNSFAGRYHRFGMLARMHYA